MYRTFQCIQTASSGSPKELYTLSGVSPMIEPYKELYKNMLKVFVNLSEIKNVIFIIVSVRRRSSHPDRSLGSLSQSLPHSG
jgi:hypothetical protein